MSHVPLYQMIVGEPDPVQSKETELSKVVALVSGIVVKPGNNET